MVCGERCSCCRDQVVADSVPASQPFTRQHPKFFYRSGLRSSISAASYAHRADHRPHVGAISTPATAWRESSEFESQAGCCSTRWSLRRSNTTTRQGVLRTVRLCSVAERYLSPLSSSEGHSLVDRGHPIGPVVGPSFASGRFSGRGVVRSSARRDAESVRRCHTGWHGAATC